MKMAKICSGTASVIPLCESTVMHFKGIPLKFANLKLPYDRFGSVGCVIIAQQRQRVSGFDQSPHHLCDKLCDHACLCVCVNDIFYMTSPGG